MLSHEATGETIRLMNYNSAAFQGRLLCFSFTRETETKIQRYMLPLLPPKLCPPFFEKMQLESFMNFLRTSRPTNMANSG